MIFAAGLGTRLRPLTDTMPKALVEVGGKPLLAHVLQRIRQAGFERAVVNVHHFPQQIIDYLDSHPLDHLQVSVSDESDQLLETGGGIRKAFPLFSPDSNILIHNVDILSNVDLAGFYEQAQADEATLLVSERSTSRYLLFDEEMRLVGWTNIQTGEVRSPYPDLNPKDYRAYAFSGIHVISPRLVAAMDTWPNRFGIIDFYLAVCGKCRIRGIVKPDLRLLDVGKIDSLHEAGEFLKTLPPSQVEQISPSTPIPLPPGEAR